MKKTIQLSFSEFTINEAPDNKFVWYGTFLTKNKFFEGQIPVCIMTDKENVDKETIFAVEGIVSGIEYYLKKSITFLKKTLTEQKEEYKISSNEVQYLSLDIEDFPVGFPEITFWQGDEEWTIRFAEGKFQICDPYGISVYFKNSEITRIENLEDCDPID
jgi:hypothetical protein